MLTGFFTGMVLALQSGMTLDLFGARSMVSRLVSASMVNQLGPVLTGLMVAGRVGSGIAAELGSMMVTDQIAALRALGTDPMRKLVLPRILAGVLMVPLLTGISVGVGLLGAWIITLTQLKVASGVYWNSVVGGLYNPGRLDGIDQAVLPGFRDRHDRLPRRAPDLGRDPGRRPGDDQCRGRQLRCRPGGEFSRHQGTHLSDVLMAVERESRSALLEEALGPGGPIVVFDNVWLAFDDKVILRESALR